MFDAMRTAATRLVRGAVYSARPIYRLAERIRGPAPHGTSEYWNGALQGPFSSYLGETLSIDLRNAVTARLIRWSVPGATSVLDLGCASATLSEVLRPLGITRYVGVDIGDVAVRSAKSQGEFHVADLRSFDVGTRRFDAVVFNEVLYYLGVDEAVDAVERYAPALNPGGALVVSMKHDPKSAAVLSRLKESFACRGGVLYQEQGDGLSYRVRVDPARAAFAVGVFAPRDARSSPGAGSGGGAASVAGDAALSMWPAAGHAAESPVAWTAEALGAPVEPWILETAEAVMLDGLSRVLA